LSISQIADSRDPQTIRQAVAQYIRPWHEHRARICRPIGRHRNARNYPPVLLSIICRGVRTPRNERCTRVRGADNFQALMPFSLSLHKCSSR